MFGFTDSRIGCIQSIQAFGSTCSNRNVKGAKAEALWVLRVGPGMQDYAVTRGTKCILKTLCASVVQK